jgi:hypothetical protein
MPTVAAAVMRHGRAFLGNATTCVVGDVGGGHDEPPWPFGCCTVMIERARTPGHFGVLGPTRR